MGGVDNQIPLEQHQKKGIYKSLVIKKTLECISFNRYRSIEENYNKKDVHELVIDMLGHPWIIYQLLIKYILNYK